jgi:putative SOS response-associated peptidase YedK
MCGRYALTSPPEIIAERFNVQWSAMPSARYNIAPGQMIPVVRQSKSGAEISLLKWGLIPSWSKDSTIGSRLINARAETVASKPSFRNAFRRRHCLIPANAFYEWKAMGTRKQPYCIGLHDGELFGMAGLWEEWHNEQGEQSETAVIITTTANQTVGQLHERMPVIIRPDDYANWLDASRHDGTEMLEPYPAELMRYFPVSTSVNRVSNDMAECMEPVDLPIEK